MAKLIYEKEVTQRRWSYQSQTSAPVLNSSTMKLDGRLRIESSGTVHVDTGPVLKNFTEIHLYSARFDIPIDVLLELLKIKIKALIT